MQDLTDALAAHRRLGKVLPRHIFAMPGSMAGDDDSLKRPQAPREPSVTLSGFRAGDMLRVTGGRFAGELVRFTKCAGTRNGIRVLRITRADGGAVVLATDVVAA